MGSKQMTKRIRLLGRKLSFDGRTYGDEHIFFGGSCVTVHFVFSNPYYKKVVKHVDMREGLVSNV